MGYQRHLLLAVAYHNTAGINHLVPIVLHQHTSSQMSNSSMSHTEHHTFASDEESTEPALLTLTEAELDVRQFHIIFSVQIRGNDFKRDE